MGEQRQVRDQINSFVVGALRSCTLGGEVDATPALEGIGSVEEALRATLTDHFFEAVEQYDGTKEKPAHLLARLAVSAATWIHRYSCRGSKRRKGQSCAVDAGIVDHIIRGIALSRFDLEFRDEVRPLISSAANATDLTEVQRVDGLSANFAEILHSHPRARRNLDIISGSPILQINTPLRHVESGLYRRNRSTALGLAPVGEERGFRVDVTSDYASPDHPAPGQEHLVRGGLLRAAAVVFITNGEGSGTGRSVEIAANAMTPTLLLRRATPADPPPPNRSRQEGELTGTPEYIFSSIEQGRELLAGFLSSESERIARRQAELISATRAPTTELTRRIRNADQAAFLDAQISWEEAQYWSDPLHLPHAGQARTAAMQQAVGLPTRDPRKAEATPQQSNRTDRHDLRSRKSLAAYAQVANLQLDRVITLWDSRHAYGPSPVRRDTPLSVEDWDDLNRRLPG